MKRKSIILISIGAAILIATGLAYAQRTAIKDFFEEASRPSLPIEEPYKEVVESAATDTEAEQPSQPESAPLATSTPPEPAVTIPAEKLLAVPFTSQAPHMNWDYPYQETCEEASALMVAGYYNGETGVIPTDEADRRILDLVAYQDEHYGFYRDTSATETKRLIEAYYPELEATVLPLGSVNDIKEYITAGIPVVLPADGKALPNPNFRNGGPLYHMLVVIGYTDEFFITNDPGTRKGEKFIYTYSGLLDAVHDWNGGDVPNGEPLMIIITPRQ